MADYSDKAVSRKCPDCGQEQGYIGGQWQECDHKTPYQRAYDKGYDDGYAAGLDEGQTALRRIAEVARRLEL